MATIGRLVVSLAANSAKLVQDLNKSRKDVNSWASRIERRAKQAATILGNLAKTAAAGFASLATVAAGAITSITVRAGTIREMENLANATGVTVENMQRWQFAAKSVNIESDKMADILKDVGDKLGDFLVTGGGGAADLFEKMALDAKDFIGLSPDQALLKIGQALDGLTQNEKIFFMESLAGDASLLLPLLEDNAEGFRRLAEEAEASGRVLDSDGVAAATRLSEAWEDLTDMARGFFDQITVLAAPVLAKLFEGIKSGIDQFGGMELLAKRVAVTVIDGVINMIGALETLLETIDAVSSGWQRFLQTSRNAIGSVGNVASDVVDVVPGLGGAADVGRDVSQSFLNVGDDARRRAEEIEARSRGRGESLENLRNFVRDARGEIMPQESTTGGVSLVEDRALNETMNRIFQRADDLRNQETQIKLDLRTDVGNLTGKVTGSREFAQAVQTLAAQAINNTARGVNA